MFNPEILAQNAERLATINANFVAIIGIKLTEEAVAAISDSTLALVGKWYEEHNRKFNIVEELIEEDALKYAFTGLIFTAISAAASAEEMMSR